MIRQGEILLIPVKELPASYHEATTQNALLAIGETGNAHTLTAERVDWLHSAVDEINEIESKGVGVTSDDVFVRVSGGNGKIEHADRKHGHAEAPVADGLYLVRIKREQMPWEAEARNVLD